MDRRSMLNTSAAMTAGAVAACALPGTAADSAAAKTPFAVAGVTLPIAGSALVFPVRRIYCIGRNYAAHAREMGSDPTREPPFFFQKPTDAIQNVAPGTVAPENVGPVVRGDVIDCHIDGLPNLGVRIV